MLLSLGWLDLDQGRYKEALVILNKAKAVLAQHKEGNAYGTLLTDMGICHQQLQQWSEAVVCYKEDVEHTCNLRGKTMRPHCTTSLGCSPTSSSTRRPSRALRRHLPSVRGCSVTSMSALS